jgi:hypothetical protein
MQRKANNIYFMLVWDIRPTAGTLANNTKVPGKSKVWAIPSTGHLG